MKRLITVLLLSLGILLPARAVTPPQGQRHLVRAGWGDSLFESLAFHENQDQTHFAYTGHFFADYQYNLTRVVSMGAQADIQGIFWTENNVRSRNYDVTLMPTVRFTWLHTDWVRLYSGLGAGVLFAFDNAGGLDVAPAVDIQTIGVQIGKTPWCGSIDFGFLSALKNAHYIYMFGSRLVSVSVNYRW